MNRAQLIAIGSGFTLVLFMAVYPPWHTDDPQHGQTSVWVFDRKVGRGLLWSPPRFHPPRDRTDPYVRVDGEQLLAEITAIASLTGIVVAGLGIASIRRDSSVPDSLE
jgi:hypothetical protein